MKLIPREFAETAMTNSLVSPNPYEEARANKLLKGIFEKRKPANIGSFYVPFSLTYIVLKAVQEMIDYDCNIEFSNILIDNLKLRVDYRTITNCRFVPELQEIITSAQCKIDRTIHQRVLMSLEKRRNQNDRAGHC